MADFGPATTTDDVLAGRDLTGQTHLVTGSSGGLGLETCRALAAKGARVVMAARNAEKNSAAIATIKEQHPDADLHPVELDLGDLASVRQCADAVVAAHPQLTSVIGNAGVMATPFEHTADGFERQFGTNHLGHYVLVNRLVPALVAASPSRIVLLSSAGHSMGQVDFDDPNYANRPYDEFDSYGQSKTANILCAVEFDKRLAPHGVRAVAVHPGGIHTELGRYFTPDVMGRLQARLAERGSEGSGGGFEWKSVEAGAATSVWAATHSDLDGRGGEYLEDCGFSQPTDPDKPGTGYEAYALDPADAARLWDLSEQLTGETLPAM